jgi:rhodanese-related sulfurtransferase
MGTTLPQLSISPQDLQCRLQESPAAELLDVRTPPEFQTVHVPGARLVPLDDLDPQAYLASRPANTGPIYVLCQSGNRAARAVEKFRQAGFDGCVLVEGGTQAWIDCGLPVNRGTSSVLPLMRQVQITAGFISAVGATLALIVNPLFALIPLFIGSGLLFAGLTGTCGLALLLAKMPWNREPRHTGNACRTASK